MFKFYSYCLVIGNVNDIGIDIIIGVSIGSIIYICYWKWFLYCICIGDGGINGILRYINLDLFGFRINNVSQDVNNFMDNKFNKYFII